MMSQPNESVRRPDPREEGAAMMVVMLVLLMTTATAVFAIHATSFEIRAAGHNRVAMQSTYVAEGSLTAAMAWVDQVGPAAVLSAMEQMRVAGDSLSLAPFEIDLHENKEAYRLYSGDLLMGATVSGVEVVDHEGVGPRQNYTPLVVVDIYDNHSYTGNVPGYRSDGYNNMRFMRATYTARGRMRATGDTDTPSGRQFHEAAADARAQAVSGPFQGG